MLLRFDPFRDLTPTWTRPLASALPVDAVRHGNEVVVTVDLPGVNLSDVDVTVDRQVLTITATKHAPSQAEGTRVLATERSRGRMTRRFTLGDTVDAGGITADLDQGVLTVRLPVAETARPRRIEIGTSAPAATSADTEGEPSEDADAAEAATAA